MPAVIEKDSALVGSSGTAASGTTTLDWSEIGTFARTLAGEPVLTLYVDGRVMDPAERRAWRVQVEHELGELHGIIARDDAAGREAFARAAEQVRFALDESFRGAIGAAGIAVFATPEAVLRMDALPSPVATEATWGSGPRVAPYASALAAMRTALVLIVAGTKVRMLRVRGSHSEAIAELDADAAVHETLTRSRARSTSNLRPSLRGATRADAAHRQREVAFDRMLAVLTEAVITASGPDDLVVVGGPGVPAHAAAALLDARTPRDVVLEAGLDEYASDAEVRAVAARATARCRDARNAARLADLVERGQATRRSAIGVMAVASALEHGAVMELLITPGLVHAEAALADDVVAATLQQGGTVSVMEGQAARDLEEEGGVAALLRFTPIPSAYGVGWEAPGRAA